MEREKRRGCIVCVLLALSCAAANPGLTTRLTVYSSDEPHLVAIRDSAFELVIGSYFVKYSMLISRTDPRV